MNGFMDNSGNMVIADKSWDETKTNQAEAEVLDNDLVSNVEDGLG